MSGSAWEVARILERHVARVVVVSPADTGIRQARAKTDRLDARTLARLLAAGELNRAVAVASAFGPAAGLEILEELDDEPSLKAYHLVPSVRGDLLARLGRYQEAQAELQQAASLAGNARERRLLLDRAAACAWQAAR